MISLERPVRLPTPPPHPDCPNIDISGPQCRDWAIEYLKETGNNDMASVIQQYRAQPDIILIWQLVDLWYRPAEWGVYL